MKKEGSVLVGIGFMFLKSNLFLIESTTFYFYTNIIGALLLFFYLFKTKEQSLTPLIVYTGFNLISYFSMTYQLDIFYALSSLLLLINILVFVFPILALFSYLTQTASDHPSNEKSKQMIKICIVLAIVAGFILFTGVLLSFTLTIVQVLTIVIMILEAIVFVSSFFKILKTK